MDQQLIYIQFHFFIQYFIYFLLTLLVCLYLIFFILFYLTRYITNIAILNILQYIVLESLNIQLILRKKYVAAINSAIWNSDIISFKWQTCVVIVLFAIVESTSDSSDNLAWKFLLFYRWNCWSGVHYKER